MSTTYRRTDTNSGLTGGADFTKAVLDPAADATGSSSFSVVNLATEDSLGFTDVGVPGADGITGDYAVELDITTGATSYEISVAVARVNSAGVQQAISAFTAEQQATAGVKTFTRTAIDLGTWAAGDRLKVVYRIRSTRDHGGADTITVAHGGTNNEVTAPWTSAPPLQSITVGKATETETAKTVTAAPGPVAVSVGSASETETAKPITVSSTVTITVGTAAETETAKTVTAAPGPVTITVGKASETETAKPITVSSTVTITVGTAAETETAKTVTAAPGPVTITVGKASETETAKTVTVTGGEPPPQFLEAALLVSAVIEGVLQVTSSEGG
jgi:hypothetical protein